MIDCNDYTCPMEVAIAIIGGKWKVPILWHLTDRPHRFGELKRIFPKATQKMLTQQLRELEADGIIIREVFSQVPPKVVYSLSANGRKLEPIMDLLSEWGWKYMQDKKEEQAADSKEQ